MNPNGYWDRANHPPYPGIRDMSYNERRSAAKRAIKEKARMKLEIKLKFRKRAQDRMVALKTRHSALGSMMKSMPEASPELRCQRDQYVGARRNLILGISGRNSPAKLSSPSNKTLARAAAVIFSSPVQFTISQPSEHSKSPLASGAQIPETVPPCSAHGPVRVSVAGGQEFSNSGRKIGPVPTYDHVRCEGTALHGPTIHPSSRL